jgi:dUTP pyrophosphatase
MEIIYQQSDEALKNKINPPQKAYFSDSGFDIFSPIDFELYPNERKTIDLQVKFELLSFQNIPVVSIGMEAMIRPKSGRTKSGLDIKIGTIDNTYRGYVGATVVNTTKNLIKIQKNEKICQIVFMPVFNSVKIIPGKVKENTDRSTGGFGSTGLK